MDDTQQQAFLEAYDTHYEMIVRYLIRHDLASETFYKALKAFDRYQVQTGKPILAWLYRIALNELRMHWRKQHQYHFEALEDYPELRSPQPSPEHLAILNEDTHQLQLALQTLNEVDRNLVSLRFFAELSLEELADITELKLGTVKSRLSRAMKKLQRQLQPFASQYIISSVRPD